MQRKGFTLVELIVVVAIIAVLAGLVYMIGPALQRNQAASRGAEQVQSTLFNAKQIALRDKNLYGVRLVPDADGHFRTLQYIYQPADYVRNQVMVDPSTPTVATFAQDLSDGFGDPNLWPVQVGDYLQIQGTPQPRRIPVGGLGNLQIAFPSAITGPPSFTSDFKIMRAPRPVPGEETIYLPENVIIDGPRSQITADPATGKYDILFATAGPIVGAAGRSGKIVLWVRDITTDPTTAAEQTLITIFTRSGAVGAYLVDTSPNGDPYSFTYDPRPNGL